MSNMDFNFHKTTMPWTRNADYYLACLNDSVFIDFNRTWQNLIYLKRISFDGYGCCELGRRKNKLNKKDSKFFIEVLKQDKLNQKELTNLVLKAIAINRAFLWEDALNEYGFIDG